MDAGKSRAHRVKPSAPADKVKGDAKGALAPSQADAKRDGSLTIDGSGLVDKGDKAGEPAPEVSGPTSDPQRGGRNRSG